jgi:hypothetical protein
MSHPKVPLAPDTRRLSDRAARAWTERMAVTPLGGGAYRVETHDDHAYTVDVPGRRCTCPDHRYRHERCKHLRRVAIEINLERVPPPGRRRADCAACGREAFVPETSDPPLCDDCRLAPGDVATDRETGDRLVVGDVLAARAGEYAVAGTDDTVATYETNAAYPADDLVVEAAYLGSVVGDDEPRVYAFPHSRLRRVEDATLVE